MDISNLSKNHGVRINYPFIGAVVGNMCLIEILFLFPSFLVAFFYQDGAVFPFLITMVIMLLVGLFLVFYGKQRKMPKATGIREGMLSVTTTWIILSLISMLPFLLGGYVKSVFDAFFETVSGFTTTGSTIFEEVECLPRSILLWRAILQWQGGIGIVVFTVALMPTLGVGGGLLYNAETSGIKHERFMPRIKEVAKRLWILYVALTLILIFFLMLGNMSFFDSVCHAFSCVSTGGFSTRNLSIGAYQSPYIEYVLTFFMFIGSLNMTLLYFAFLGKPKLFKDGEFRWYSIFVAICVLLLTVWIYRMQLFGGVEESFRKILFSVISIVTSTGFSTTDINKLTPLFHVVGLFLMLICGCAGSTSGGLKISRLMVIGKNLNNEFLKRIHPRMVTHVRFNGNSIPGEYVMQVLAFATLYFAIIFLATIVLAMCGNSLFDSLSASMSNISNAGICFGRYSSSFADATILEKVVLSFIMIAGRLEVFTVICILTPRFWRYS